MGVYKYNPPVKTELPKDSENKTGQEKPRIYNVFEPTIVLDEMSLSFSKNDNDEKKTDNYFASIVPLIKINDYYFTESEITYIEINCTKKIPIIRVSVSMSHEIFLTKELPKDGDVISIMIRSKSEVLKPIRNDYLIKNVIGKNRDTEINEKVNLTFYGELFVPGLNSYLNGFNFKGTTMQAFKQIAKNLTLGFNTNEDATDDYQLWLMKDNYFQIIDDMCENSWKDEFSFWDWWIDIYYNLNFFNVQKQLISNEQDIDMASAINSSNMEYTFGADEKNNNILPKIFCNLFEVKNTSSYIKKWAPINASSEITNTLGLTIYFTTYEHNDGLYRNPDKNKYWEIQTLPMYDESKIGSHIILRGRTYWDASINTNESAKTNYDFNELYKKYTWTGIQYTLSNQTPNVKTWDGNHHKYYKRARIQNILNIAELDKLSIEIEVQGINLNVIKGDKIPVVIAKRGMVEQELNNEDGSNFNMDRFYSGWYYVKGFNLEWSKKLQTETSSQFSQTFILSRREWPAPVAINTIK